MAKLSLILKSQKTPKFKTQGYHRCQVCGRARGYMRKFGLCRICFRSNANSGYVPGVVKASW